MNQPTHEQRPVVLVVEDEFLIRANAIDMIAAAGFDVVEAAKAEEAISVLESRNDILIVFTDVHMPGSLDGLKLAHAVRNRWPPVKLIVTSGRSIIPETELPIGGRFVRKPYEPFQIARALHGFGSS